MGFCFVCDADAEGSVCPTCGRTTWSEESESAEQNQATELHAASAAVGHDDPDRALSSPSPAWDDDVPAINVGDAPRTEIRRTGIVVGAGLLVAVLLVSVLQLPSGLDETAQPDLTIPSPEPTAPSTTSIPQTVPTTSPPIRPYRVDRTTTAIAVRIGASEYESLLDGTTIETEEPMLDLLADGTAVVLSDPARGVVTFGSETILVDPSMPIGSVVSVSPDGSNLAYIGPETIAYRRGQSTVELPGPRPEASRLLWSPDSRLLGIASEAPSYSIWDTVTGEPIVEARPGHLLAVSFRGLLVWTGQQLELRQDDRMLRSWREMFVALDGGVPHAEFSPTGDHVALEATFEGNEGLWVLSTFGSDQERLGPSDKPSKTFTWSGAGDGVYLIAGGSLKVWPLDDDLDLTIVGKAPQESETVQTLLRVYDPAIRPPLTLGVLIGSEHSLVSDGRTEPMGEAARILSGRSSRTYTIVRPTTDGFSLSIEGPDLTEGFVVGTVTTEVDPDELVVVWNRELSRGVAIEFGLPPPEDELAGTVIAVSNQELYAASLTHPAEAVTLLESGRGYAITVSPSGERLYYTDGESVVEVTADSSQTVANARELGLDRIDALAVGRNDLFVGGSRDDGIAVVIAPDRTLLVDAGATSVGLLFGEQAGTLAISTTGQGDDGPQTIIASIQASSTQVPGVPLAYSADGHWLLATTPDEARLISTRGRGVLELQLAPPDAAVWLAD